MNCAEIAIAGLRPDSRPFSFLPPPLVPRYVAPQPHQEAIEAVQRELRSQITRPTHIQLEREDARALLQHIEELEARISRLTAGA